MLFKIMTAEDIAAEEALVKRMSPEERAAHYAKRNAELDAAEDAYEAYVDRLYCGGSSFEDDDMQDPALRATPTPDIPF